MLCKALKLSKNHIIPHNRAIFFTQTTHAPKTYFSRNNNDNHDKEADPFMIDPNDPKGYNNWKFIPIFPLAMFNVPMGLCFMPQFLLNFAIPPFFGFDIAALALLGSTFRRDIRIIQGQELEPGDSLLGKPLDYSMIRYLSFATSAFLAMGTFGAEYIVAMEFWIFGYMGFLGGIKGLSMLVPHEQITDQKALLSGSFAGGIFGFLFADLTEVDPAHVDLTNCVFPIELAFCYFVGKQFFSIYKETCMNKVMNLKEMEPGQAEFQTTRFLLLFKYTAILAYLVHISLILVAEKLSSNRREQLEKEMIEKREKEIENQSL